MKCKNCQKEIDDDSKFCEFCQSKICKDYSDVIKQMEKAAQTSGKRKKVFKNTILIISVFITIAFFLEAMVNDLDGAGLFFAIPMTLLVIFIYNKIAKRFDL